MLSSRLNRPSWSTVKKTCVFLLVVAGVAWLYLWHLGTLTPGLSPAEALARAATVNFHSIYVNPINAPQKLLQYGLQAAGHNGAFWMRLPAVLFSIVFLGLFYSLVKNWFGRVVSTLATIMLASTPWIILLARNATATILLLAPIATLCAYTWFSRSKGKNKELAWFCLLIVSAISLYVPGMIWLLLAGGIIVRKEMITMIKQMRRPVVISAGVIKLVILLPLLAAIVRHGSVLKSLILWPAHWSGIIIAVKATTWAGLALIWRTPYHIDIIIGRLPVLSITQIVLIFFGSYALWSKARRQLYLLAGLIGFSLVASGLNQNLLLITLGLPAIMVMMAGGLRFLYVEWRSVFPNNPIPRALAVTLMVLLVSLNVVFGIRYALVAWPHTLVVQHSYVIK